MTPTRSGRLVAAAVTHRGAVRGGNEDAVLVGSWVCADRQAGDVIRIEQAARGPLVVAVADGLGGHAGGEEASRLAVGLVAANAARLIGDGIADIVNEVNVAVVAQGERDRSLYGSGCTLAAVTFDGETAWVVNVGDSRVYRVVDGRLGQLSEDDRPPRMPGQPDDVQTSVLTQCLGGTGRLTDVQPHVRKERLQPGDRFLLCSDGLTDYVGAERIIAAAGRSDPVAVVEDLLAAALAAGAPDNVTIVLAGVEGVPER